MQSPGEHQLNPDAIRLLSWNVMKQSRPILARDLARMSRDVDLALLQEVHMEGGCLQHFDNNWHRSFAPGFRLPGRTTGVMTVSNIGYRAEDSFSHTEPVIRTPKATNVTIYDVAGTKAGLLVVNLHAVNFSLGMQAYTRQLHDLLEYIDAHDGPVIFAGDFNAWHNQRKLLLDEIALHRGLSEVIFPEDQRMQVFGKHLDYIFVRDLQVLEARTLHSEGSDHNPLLATVSL